MTPKPLKASNPKKPLLTVIVPVFNERAFIGHVLERVRSTRVRGTATRPQIVVVDDGSTDGTADEVKKISSGAKDISFVRHEKNRGKGAAIRTGLEHATGDVTIIQDADLEYDPAEYQKLLDPILQGRADVVYGSRFAPNEPHRVLYFWHSMGNRLLTFISNMFTDLNLTDMETGYKAFRTELLRSVKIEEDRFGFEPEITAKMAKLTRKGTARIYEVGVAYHGRTYQEGKKIGWKDGLRALVCIVRYNLFRS